MKSISKSENRMEMTENELLLLIDIVKDKFGEDIVEMKNYGDNICENREISWILKRKILPLISTFFASNRTFNETPNFLLYEDELAEEDIKYIRKKFKNSFKERNDKYINYIINRYT